MLLAVLPGLACDSPGPNEGAGDCRTLRHKTHSTRTGDELTVVYAWHPWAGRLVYIHDVVDRAIGASARCSLIGVPDARVQELPIWMLEAAACRSVRLTCEPIVPLAAFAALQRLLLATVRPVTMEESSDARIASPERHRGDRHAKSKTASSPPSPGPPIRARIGGRSTGGNSTLVVTDGLKHFFRREPGSDWMTAPENGSSVRTSAAKAARPWAPLRKSTGCFRPCRTPRAPPHLRA